VALVAQLLMLRWRSWLPGAEQGRTLFGGVRAAVYTLMSHLT
jgi:light-harvesting complex 1 beta chain